MDSSSQGPDMDIPSPTQESQIKVGTISSSLVKESGPWTEYHKKIGCRVFFMDGELLLQQNAYMAFLNLFETSQELVVPFQEEEEN